MRKKSPVAEAISAKVVKTKFRGGEFEENGLKQLVNAGVKVSYEGVKVPYTVPSRDANYLPDFVPDGTNIVLEFKGHFGGLGRDMKRVSAEQRQKYVLVKEQHPELDIRFVFQRANAKIYKGSPTTHAKWADDHGFRWSDKGIIPPAWIADILNQQRKGKK